MDNTIHPEEAPNEVHLVYWIVRGAAGTLYSFERLYSKTHPDVVQRAKLDALRHVEDAAREAKTHG